MSFTFRFIVVYFLTLIVAVNAKKEAESSDVSHYLQASELSSYLTTAVDAEDTTENALRPSSPAAPANFLQEQRIVSEKKPSFLQETSRMTEKARMATRTTSKTKTKSHTTSKSRTTSKTKTKSKSKTGSKTNSKMSLATRHAAKLRKEAYENDWKRRLLLEVTQWLADYFLTEYGMDHDTVDSIMNQVKGNPPKSSARDTLGMVKEVAEAFAVVAVTKTMKYTAMAAGTSVCGPACAVLAGEVARKFGPKAAQWLVDKGCEFGKKALKKVGETMSKIKDKAKEKMKNMKNKAIAIEEKAKNKMKNMASGFWNVFKRKKSSPAAGEGVVEKKSPAVEGGPRKRGLKVDQITGSVNATVAGPMSKKPTKPKEEEEPKKTKTPATTATPVVGKGAILGKNGLAPTELATQEAPTTKAKEIQEQKKTQGQEGEQKTVAGVKAETASEHENTPPPAVVAKSSDDAVKKSDEKPKPKNGITEVENTGPLIPDEYNIDDDDIDDEVDALILDEWDWEDEEDEMEDELNDDFEELLEDKFGDDIDDETRDEMEREMDEEMEEEFDEEMEGELGVSKETVEAFEEVKKVKGKGKEVNEEASK